MKVERSKLVSVHRARVSIRIANINLKLIESQQNFTETKNTDKQSICIIISLTVKILTKWPIVNGSQVSMVVKLGPRPYCGPKVMRDCLKGQDGGT